VRQQTFGDKQSIKWDKLRRRILNSILDLFNSVFVSSLSLRVLLAVLISKCLQFSPDS
jgi:hypothetical protein